MGHAARDRYQRLLTDAQYIDLDKRLRTIENLIYLVLRMEYKMSATLDALTAAVAAEKTVSASIITLLAGVSQQLKDALAANDSVALNQLAVDLETNTKALQEAVTANTPAPVSPPTM